MLASQPSWSLIFLGRGWQEKEAWKNHRQLKTESTNMPKAGKHKLPRGLLEKQEHFNMASTLSCERSIRNHFGIWEITPFLILCSFNEGKGPGCDNVVTNELHLPAFHLPKENKEKKWCSSYFRGTKLRWAARKSNNRSPTGFFPKSDPVTKAEAAVMSWHMRDHPWYKILPMSW